jgi:hypothetical protein
MMLFMMNIVLEGVRLQKSFQNFTSGFCMLSMICTWGYARTVEHETCCRREGLTCDIIVHVTRTSHLAL